MTSLRPKPPVPVPTATYRLQLQPGFPFAAAEAAVPRLAALGVSHLHLSPVLEAVPGSTHGYDVVDHSRVRGELGGEAGLRALSARAREHGLGLVLDLVPNHMAASPRHNRQLWDVLREGPAAAHAHWFDIDWEAGGGRVLLPVLGGPLGGELDRLRVDGEELRYHEHRFPLRPGTAGLPLPELLDAQWYRLGWWRLARTELNYRRFFTIAELIGIRVEDPGVFAATHAKILELLADGVADGLRIDHPDGLADPAGYLARLDEASGGRWTVVEKILADGERLPGNWRVAGTTGYDALRHLDGVLTDPAGARELAARFREFAAPAPDLGGDFEATARRAAHEVLGHDLAAETARLTRDCVRLCARDPRLRDHAPWALATALHELLVRVPVYRPYPGGDPASVLTAEAAADAAAAFEVAEEAGAVEAVRGLLLGEFGGDGGGGTGEGVGGAGEGDGRAGADGVGADEDTGAGEDRVGDGRAEVAAFAARFAQTASALRAKSIEDRAFYRYVPLLSADEVGGEPGAPALGPEAFHAYCARLQRDWPLTGTVLSTHDTKRSADVRAAISVLAQCPGRWAELLGELTALTARTGVPAPDHLVAWAGWQTALGLGVPEVGRLREALLKHVREAGLRTTWTEPDAAYETAVADFVAAGPGGPAGKALAEFGAGLRPFVEAQILAATLLQLTMPGVPDLYQGTEYPYRALVDPDNRAPLAAEPDDGDEETGELPALKRQLTVAALQLRRRRPELFGTGGSYAPLAARGPAAGHCLAFTRGGAVLSAVTRLPLRLAEEGGWDGTVLQLPPGRWRDVCAPELRHEGRLPVAELFARRPFALLEREEPGREEAGREETSGG
ncbi:malto-oligosyltrehalose synthase [Streptomyces physcomitrii]|uniref:Malto-oligosyltrehalose synthase n=1 Tax=Streptomyces physcomitrii TaxID=2724184 RepID=A0ABX1H7Z0_9ACTN|nr:malto-oligosyltrehalose synthase [Streptomyces physcomitrii]NKI44499.1 malto-oligosyltrehalose synthase [Streptomyces physcomitrii]